MSAAHEFPSELHDKIMDFETANQCALVARAWLQRARYLWWSNFPIPLFPLDHPHVRFAEDFVEMITHPHCTFTHLYSVLWIQGPDGRFQFPEEEAAIYKKSDRMILRISNLPVKLDYLIFENLTTGRMQSSSVAILSSFQDVSRIEFRSTDFPSMAEFCSFAACFPLLHTLSAEFRDRSPSWLPPLPEPETYRPSPLVFRSLRHMSLKVSQDFDYFVAALRCYRCPVEEVFLHDLETETSGLVNPLLSHIGPALKSLKLQATEINGLTLSVLNSIPTPHVSLIQNISLTSLTIDPIVILEAYPYPTWWITRILGSITSPNFKSLMLKFEFGTSSSRCFGQFLWSQLDHLAERLPQLECISIDITVGVRFYGDDIGDLVLAIKSHLPKLMGTDKLVVTQSIAGVDVDVRNYQSTRWFDVSAALESTGDRLAETNRITEFVSNVVIIHYPTFDLARTF